MFCLSSFLRFLSSKVPSMRLFRWSVLNEGQTLSFLWSSDSCCRVPVKQDNLSAKYWSIGNFLCLYLVWFGILTVSAFVQLELAVRFSRMICETVHDDTFSCGRSLDETFHCEVLSAKNSSEFGWISVKVPCETLQVKCSQRGTNLVSSLKFGFSFVLSCTGQTR